MLTRSSPPRYRDSPVWLAFELWADEHFVSTAEEDWFPWWACFLTGFEIGQAEAA